MMSEWTKELTKRLVVGHTRDGRCIYDEQAKRELIRACREPGASVSKLARDCGVNANQLSTWARQFELAGAKTAAAPARSGPAVPQAAFVPAPVDDAPVVEQSVCVALQAHLPTGVVVARRACDMRQARGLLDALG